MAPRSRLNTPGKVVTMRRRFVMVAFLWPAGRVTGRVTGRVKGTVAASASASALPRLAALRLLA